MKKLSLALILGGLLIAACGGAATPIADVNVPVVTDDFAVVAEGRLLPAQFANLSFEAGGKIAEVLVTEGQGVNADDVIARLENSESLKAQVAGAEAELLNAQQAIDTLNDGWAMSQAKATSDVANAKKALDDAQRKLKNLNYPDIEWYQEQVDKANDALATAQENVQVLDIGSLQAALQSARDAQEKIKERLDKVRSAVEACKECDPKGSFTVDGFPQTLDDAQDAYNDISNRIKEIEIQIAQAQRGNTQAIDDAQERLEDAQHDLQFAQSGPKPLDVELAQANAALAAATLKDAEDRLAELANGPDPDLLAAAQARLAAAQASLEAAKDALKNSELRAPFAGVVADVRIKVGEQAAPGQPAVVLADFSGWVVETDNLTEIEVVKVAEGQNASVVLDALPEVTLTGKVKSISPVFEEKRGDITYTVTITLTDIDPKMRWGMTAVTTFEK
jgi:multidrug resistance efflux pump